VFNCTPLHISSRYGNFSVVEYLINQKAQINICATGHEMRGTPLHCSALYNHQSIAELLLNHGADVNANTSYFFKNNMMSLLFILHL